MPNTQPLAEFCAEHTQSEAARIIGCSQGNVSQMLKSGREIFIVEDDHGRQSHYEIRRSTRGTAA